MPQTIDNIAQTGGGLIEMSAGLPNETLAGRRGWIISDGVTGHLAITRGIAETLGLDAQIKQIEPRFPWWHLAPNGPADPRTLRLLLAEPLPEIVIGAGRQTVPIIRALKRRGAFTVLCQSPRAFGESADVIWAPVHDRLSGPNVIATLTPPHRFSPPRLDELRRSAPEAIAALPRLRVACLIGGPGAGYKYDASVIADLTGVLARISASAGCFLITPSRRTPPELLRAIDETTRPLPRILWNGDGENPYPHFLALADAFIVTADSVNMVGEACATGRPVHIFTPPGGRAKFRRFHQALQEHGATRPLSKDVSALDEWTYEPLNAAETVAAEIEKRWRQRRSTAGDVGH
ncbi:MAG: mitochondrial fission ELM1 family protein [Rhodomicrobiaceae bacterium]